MPKRFRAHEVSQMKRNKGKPWNNPGSMAFRNGTIKKTPKPQPIGRVVEDKFFNDPIFIVAKADGLTVHLKPFHEVVRGSKDARTVILTDILKQPHIGDDGKVVDFNLGALVRMEPTIVKDVDGNDVEAFHIANVTPADEDGDRRWAWAKCVLGLSRADKPEDAVLLQDGQFRQATLEQVNSANAEIMKAFTDAGLGPEDIDIQEVPTFEDFKTWLGKSTE